MAEFPPPQDIVLAHFIVSNDVERSKRFYTEVLGGKLASWIIINVGGGRPTTSRRSRWRRRAT